LQSLSNVTNKLTVDFGQLDHGVPTVVAEAVVGVVTPGIDR
jgi:hypothetical protein